MHRPLADEIRPKTLDEVVGQRHLLAPGGVLRRLIDAGTDANMVFYGPSGTGKTLSLIHILISDPQTSGGLLVALPMEEARALLAALRERDPDSAIIGAVVAQTEHTLEIV